jgi:predicted transglutaminase-like cysteine proteinase
MKLIDIISATKEPFNEGLGQTLKMTVAAGLTLVATMLGSPSASASDMMPINIEKGMAPPKGFILYCMNHQIRCPAKIQSLQVEMDSNRWAQLASVQHTINASIRGRDDTRDPNYQMKDDETGEGSCSQYALAKMKKLISLGWPQESLLLAAAYTETGEGHMVLVVTTTSGDYVLDNRQRDVVFWKKLPYKWIERQNQENHQSWLAIQ